MKRLIFLLIILTTIASCIPEKIDKPHYFELCGEGSDAVWMNAEYEKELLDDGCVRYSFDTAYDTAYWAARIDTNIELRNVNTGE